MTGGNGPSCSGWVTNVSIEPEDVGISTMRSCMVRRHYAALDGGVKTPRRRGSMAALFSPLARRCPDAIRLALRGAATLQRHQHRLEQALQGNAGAVRAGRPGRLRQP